MIKVVQLYGIEAKFVAEHQSGHTHEESESLIHGLVFNLLNLVIGQRINLGFLLRAVFPALCSVHSLFLLGNLECIC